MSPYDVWVCQECMKDCKAYKNLDTALAQERAEAAHATEQRMRDEKIKAIEEFVKRIKEMQMHVYEHNRGRYECDAIDIDNIDQALNEMKGEKE